MGLDINLFRKDKGHDPEVVRKSVAKRYDDVKIVDEIIERDTKARESVYAADSARGELNAIKKKIGEKKKKDKTDKCEEELAEKEKIEKSIDEFNIKAKEATVLVDALLNKVGNLVHESVPDFKDEVHNKVERTWGEKSEKVITDKPRPGFCHHHEVLHMIDGYEQQRGTKVAGHRGYFLKGYGLLLVQALQQYGLRFLMQKEYTPIQPPYFMKSDIMNETCQLSDFEENLYKIDMKKEKHKQEETKQEESKDSKNKQEKKEEIEDFYLIATSEQPICAMYRKEWLAEKELPIRYAGSSTCFRKEAGSHGRETWGLFRIHQFEKVEQLIICKPEESWNELDKMVASSEQFLQSLKLPYQVVSIVSGGLNDAAAKKYDIEAWYPGYNQYKELVSCSNCTDFQSRALEIRCGSKKADQKEKLYVHMLNGTLCACQRTFTCILENYQEEEGLRVPEVLIPFVGTDFIKYTKPIPSKKDLE